MQVRFASISNYVNGRSSTEHKIATINYDFFSNIEMTSEERMINPLGFQVIGYRLDDEVL